MPENWFVRVFGKVLGFFYAMYLVFLAFCLFGVVVIGIATLLGFQL